MLAVILVVAVMQQSAMPLTTLAQGSQSAVEERRETVVRTPAEWQMSWKWHGGSEAAPTVDFAKEMVVAVFLGTKPTGGYRVEITGARREGQSLVIEYAERRPGPGTLVTQALTSPYHIVKLPRHDGPVTFRAAAAAPPR